MNEPLGTRIHILIELDGNGRQTGSQELQSAIYDYDAPAPSDPESVTWKQLIAATLIGAIAGAIACLFK